MCVFKTKFEQADLAKKRVALFGRKQSLDDRLNMVFVNLTIGAGLVNKWQGTSVRLCSLKQPQNQANRPARPFIYIYDEMQPEIRSQVSLFFCRDFTLRS
jgi:hypothetical protein